MSKFTAVELESKNKAELRELCRANGIGYNGMNNDGMRAALLTVPGAEQPMVEETVQVGTGIVDPATGVEETVAQSTGVMVPAPQPVELPPVMQQPATPAAPVRKIQTGRPERNGVKRPSEGTICAQIWAWCDKEHDATGKVNAKDLRAALPALDDTTKTVQFYRWRKFNGIKGRA